ncbi:MAG TPA: prolipoprotein diacylglyceryl transferase family protein [Enhygromyxa sp.]|nr:prolipoprotein diacylglyceryl transferase family protein [Enhygromyxa sp.]
MNLLFDRLVHGSLALGERSMPWFALCGFAGLAVGVAIAIALGLANGLSLVLVAASIVACLLALVLVRSVRRRLLTDESMVVMEHLWAAAGLSAAMLVLLDVEPWPYLDPMAVGAAFGLAIGRLGCAMAGCCHGIPSSWGIAYPPGEWGHPRLRWKNGLRLFPVQILAALSLVTIGVIAIPLALVAEPGSALRWFLAGYAIQRFTLEGLRGDRRPRLLGWSAARWMCVIQTVFVLGLDAATWGFAERVAAVGLTLTTIALITHNHRRRREQGFAPDFGQRLRAALVEARSVPDSRHEFEIDGLRVIVQPARADDELRISLQDRRSRPLRSLCEQLCAAVPSLAPSHVVLGSASIVHLRVDGQLLVDDDECSPSMTSDAEPPWLRGDRLYGSLVRARPAAQPH